MCLLRNLYKILYVRSLKLVLLLFFFLKRIARKSRLKKINYNYQEVVRLTWKREWQPTPVCLPGEFQGQRNLVGYSPWSHKELDTTEWITHTHTHTVRLKYIHFQPRFLYYFHIFIMEPHIGKKTLLSLI